MNQDPSIEFTRLVQQALEGTLAPAEAAQLNKLLKQDADLREEYRRHCELHSTLLSKESIDFTADHNVYLLAARIPP